jgi:hypothetical protein
MPSLPFFELTPNYQSTLGLSHSLPVLACIQLKRAGGARHQWLTPLILATQEAEIRKIRVKASLGK